MSYKVSCLFLVWVSRNRDYGCRQPVSHGAFSLYVDGRSRSTSDIIQTNTQLYCTTSEQANRPISSPHARHGIVHTAQGIALCATLLPHALQHAQNSKYQASVPEPRRTIFSDTIRHNTTQQGNNRNSLSIAGLPLYHHLLLFACSPPPRKLAASPPRFEFHNHKAKIHSKI